MEQVYGEPDVNAPVRTKSWPDAGHVTPSMKEQTPKAPPQPLSSLAASDCTLVHGAESQSRLVPDDPDPAHGKSTDGAPPVSRFASIDTSCASAQPGSANKSNARPR